MIEYDDTIGQEVIVVEPVEISMAAINETADRIISISNNISSSITTWKEMDMHFLTLIMKKSMKNQSQRE